ncbi:MAG: exodeoxyribonuclease VII small subunit [Solirubrobacteraceae bacterium]|jgi:exonuclease VII small subunit
MSQSTDITYLSSPTEMSFEAGYERLQEIAGRLSEDEVSVSEMCDLFAEGKGLEIALTGFLDTQRERVEAIERGEGIRAFRITRSPAAATAEARADDTPVDTGDFVPEPTRGASISRPTWRTSPG